MARTLSFPTRQTTRRGPPTRPPIGSAWHTRTGANVFVSDVYERQGQIEIRLVSEHGQSLTCRNSDLGTIFRKGYRQ
jgi:hypothetical protein